MLKKIISIVDTINGIKTYVIDPSTYSVNIGKPIFYPNAVFPNKNKTTDSYYK